MACGFQLRLADGTTLGFVAELLGFHYHDNSCSTGSMPFEEAMMHLKEGLPSGEWRVANGEWRARGGGGGEVWRLIAVEEPL